MSIHEQFLDKLMSRRATGIGRRMMPVKVMLW